MDECASLMTWGMDSTSIIAHQIGSSYMDHHFLIIVCMCVFLVMSVGASLAKMSFYGHGQNFERIWCQAQIETVSCVALTLDAAGRRELRQDIGTCWNERATTVARLHDRIEGEQQVHALRLRADLYSALHDYLQCHVGCTGCSHPQICEWVGGCGFHFRHQCSNLYAPKEFSKENIPKKNVKTFNDVKGCDKAKAELEEIVEYLRNPAKFTRLGGKLRKVRNFIPEINNYGI